MKLVRVHNPSGLRATKRKVKKTMARRKRTTVRHRTRRAVATNPRHRRRHARRRNPVIVARSRRRRATVHHRRRHHRRRHNPSALHVGQIFKNILYGTGGAIGTRVVASIANGFVPSGFAGNPLVGPALQALIAATLIRWAGGKFLGKPQGDAMMFGGFISAGLDAADKIFPNVQGQLTGMFGNIVRAPVQVAPSVQMGQQGALSDVYDVPGFSDVYDVETNAFNSFN
jgi:hypothetical protein